MAKMTLELSYSNSNIASLLTGLFLLLVNLYLSAPAIYYIISLFLLVIVSSLTIKMTNFKLSKPKVVEAFIEYSSIFLISNPAFVLFILAMYLNHFKFRPIEIVSLFLSLASYYIHFFFPLNFFEFGAKLIAVSAYIFLNMSGEKLLSSKQDLLIFLGSFAFLTLTSLLPMLRIHAMTILLLFWIASKRKLITNPLPGFKQFGLAPILICALVNSQLTYLCLFIVLTFERLNQDNDVPISTSTKSHIPQKNDVFCFWALQALIFFPNGFGQSLSDFAIRISALITLEFSLNSDGHYWAFGPVITLFMMKTSDEQWSSMTLMLIRHIYVVLFPFLVKPLIFIFNNYSFFSWNKNEAASLLP